MDVSVHRPHDSEVIKRERMFYNMKKNKNMLYGKKQRFGSFFSENICAVYIGGSIAGRDRDLSVDIYI